MRGRKVGVLGLATALIAFGIDQVLAGEVYTAIASYAIAACLLLMYEHFNLQQIPLTENDAERFAEAAGQVLEDAADDVRDRIDD